jgi:hypothetical protein
MLRNKEIDTKMNHLCKEDMIVEKKHYLKLKLSLTLDQVNHQKRGGERMSYRIYRINLTQRKKSLKKLKKAIKKHSVN